MVKRGDRSSQFYLIPAIILAAIIISIVAVSNYSKKAGYTDINNLKDELQIESARVLDYGIYNELNQTEINQLLQNFTQKYIDSESRDKNLYFVFGNQNNITLKGYQKNAHVVSLNSTEITSSSGAFLGSIDPAGNSVNLAIDENSYVFTLKTGENFYFVISQEIRGEEYVVKG